MAESSSFKQALIKNEQALKKLNLMVGPCPECHHNKNLDALRIYLFIILQILSEDTEIVTQSCSILGVFCLCQLNLHLCTDANTSLQQFQ